jgi:acyl-CoA thioesterase
MNAMNSFFTADALGQYLGVELLEIAPGRARVKMMATKEHLNAHRTVHGGVLFALADIAFGLAGNSAGIPAVAINAHISFMKAAGPGPLYAMAEEFTANPILASYSVEVTNDQGDRIALFQGMAYRRRKNREKQDAGTP